jgi:hypothetical protein
MYVDRTYGRGKPQERSGRYRDEYKGYQAKKKEKTCYVYKKPFCWSNKHTPKERKKAYQEFKERRNSTHLTEFISFDDFVVFLVEFKGTEIKAFFTLSSLNNKQFLVDVDNKCFTTKLGQVDRNVIITTLND